MIKFLATAALFAAACFASPAAAGGHSWPIGDNAYHLYFNDLDLNTTTGRASMLQRVESAATKLCDARTNLRIDLTACVKQVIDDTAPRNQMLRLAMTERGAVQYAAR